MSKREFKAFQIILVFMLFAIGRQVFAKSECLELLESNKAGYRTFDMTGLSTGQKWSFFEKLLDRTVLLEVTSDRGGDGETIDLGILQQLKKGNQSKKRAELCLKLGPGDQRVENCVEFRSLKSVRIRGVSNSKKELYFPKVDLKKELQLSGISPAILKKLEKYSLGLGTMYDLIDRAGDFRYQSTSLGIDVPEYGILSKALNIETYHSVYRQLEFHEHDIRDHTEIFMEAIHGRTIVFFIPRNFLKFFDEVEYSSREGKGITIAEFKWLLKDPKRLANVYFVFGAYNAIPAHFPANSGSQHKVLQKYLLDYKAYQYAPE